MVDNTLNYPIINHGSVALRDETSADFDTVKNRFKALNPGKASDAGDAYLKAANALAEKAALLTEKHAPKLIDAWGGDAAQKALDQLGQVHWTANELSTKSYSAAQNFKWYGDEILPWYKDLGNTMSDGILHTSGDDHQAQKLMNRLNLRAQQVQTNFPASVQSNLPGQADQHGYQGDPNGPGGPGGPGGVPSGPGGGGGMPSSHLPKNDPFGSPSGNRNPHLPGSDGGNFPGGNGANFPGGGGNTSLAGYNPPGGLGPGGLGGGPGGLGGGGLGGGGLGGGGLGGDPFGAAGGVGGGASGLGAGPGGIGGVAGGFGAGGAAAEEGAAARGATGRAGMMPMHPGHNQGEKDRERSTWLTEDEDIWNGDGDAVPGEIG